MRKLFKGLWRVITAPIHWVEGASHYMNAPLEDRAFGDAVSDVARNPATLIPQIEALRKHLLRMLLALVITVGFSLAFSEKLLQIFARPIGGIDQLAAIEVTENLGVFMRIGLVTGIAIAIPYIAFEI